MTFNMAGVLGPFFRSSALLVSHDALHRVSKSALICEKMVSNPRRSLNVNTP